MNRKVSIVVPAFNEERLLPSALASILAASAAFTNAGWTIELIVCDNNSTDRTAEIAAAAGARVVFEPINQISRARNAGAAQASGGWLLFIDADSLPTRELFADVVRTIERGRCIAGGSTVRIDLEGPLYRAAIGWWNFISRTLRWAAGSFMPPAPLKLERDPLRCAPHRTVVELCRPSAFRLGPRRTGVAARIAWGLCRFVW